MFHLGVHVSRQTAHHSRKNHPVYSKMDVKREPKRQKYQLHHLSRWSFLLSWPYCALPRQNPAPGSNHSSEKLKIIYRHSFYLSKPVCGEYKMTDRENEGREMLSSQRCLLSCPLNPWREPLVLDPRCPFQTITFSLRITLHTYTSP